jgi:hypothetical protein
MSPSNFAQREISQQCERGPHKWVSPLNFYFKISHKVKPHSRVRGGPTGLHPKNLLYSTDMQNLIHHHTSVKIGHSPWAISKSPLVHWEISKSPPVSLNWAISKSQPVTSTGPILVPKWAISKSQHQFFFCQSQVLTLPGVIPWVNVPNTSLYSLFSSFP